MLPLANKQEKKPLKTDAKVKVIKNGHTNKQLSESGDRWATHIGPYMTLDEVLSAEANRQNS